MLLNFAHFTLISNYLFSFLSNCSPLGLLLLLLAGGQLPVSAHHCRLPNHHYCFCVVVAAAVRVLCDCAAFPWIFPSASAVSGIASYLLPHFARKFSKIWVKLCLGHCECQFLVVAGWFFFLISFVFVVFCCMANEVV